MQERERRRTEKPDLERGERRRSPRVPKGEPERAQLVALVLGTFREMLGTRLSLREAERMFGLRHATCRVLFEYLVGQNHLRRTADGRYTMA
jgi:hypothetical protein